MHFCHITFVSIASKSEHNEKRTKYLIYNPQKRNKIFTMPCNYFLNISLLILSAWFEKYTLLQNIVNSRWWKFFFSMLHAELLNKKTISIQNCLQNLKSYSKGKLLYEKRQIWVIAKRKKSFYYEGQCLSVDRAKRSYCLSVSCPFDIYFKIVNVFFYLTVSGFAAKKKILKNCNRWRKLIKTDKKSSWKWTELKSWIEKENNFMVYIVQFSKLKEHWILYTLTNGVLYDN